MSLQARPICASLFIRSTGVLTSGHGQEKSGHLWCFVWADYNSEKEIRQCVCRVSYRIFL